MNTWTLSIPFNVSRTSLNRRMHWRSRRRANEDAKTAARLAYQQAGEFASEMPVRIDVVLYRSRRMDQDNIWGAMKPIIDALCRQNLKRKVGTTANGKPVMGTITQSCIVPDDDEEWLQLGSVRQVVHYRWRGQERIDLIITQKESALWQ